MACFSRLPGCRWLCRHSSASPREEGRWKCCDDRELAEPLRERSPELVRSERLSLRRPLLLLLPLWRRFLCSTSFAFKASLRRAAFCSKSCPTDPRGFFSPGTSSFCRLSFPGPSGSTSLAHQSEGNRSSVSTLHHHQWTGHPPPVEVYQLPPVTPCQPFSTVRAAGLTDMINSFAPSQLLLSVPLVVLITGCKVLGYQDASTKVFPIQKPHNGISLRPSTGIIAFIFKNAILTHDLSGILHHLVPPILWFHPQLVLCLEAICNQVPPIWKRPTFCQQLILQLIHSSLSLWATSPRRGTPGSISWGIRAQTLLPPSARTNQTDLSTNQALPRQPAPRRGPGYLTVADLTHGELWPASHEKGPPPNPSTPIPQRTWGPGRRDQLPSDDSQRSPLLHEEAWGPVETHLWAWNCGRSYRSCMLPPSGEYISSVNLCIYVLNDLYI